MAERKFAAVYQADIIKAESGSVPCGLEGVVTVIPLDVLEKRYGPGGGGQVTPIAISEDFRELMDTLVKPAMPVPPVD